MKRVFSFFIILLFVISIISGCSSAKKDTAVSSSNTTAKSSSSAAAADGKKSESISTESKQKVQTASKDQYGNVLGDTDFKSLTTSGTTTENNTTVTNAILAQRKIIRNANISIEVDDFNVAYGQIKSAIGAFGYIQESNIKKDKVYVNSQQKLITKGVIIIRVDKDRFDSILSDVKGLGLLTDESIKSDDVTDQFIDTESMLRLLKYEESKLEEYLYKLNDADTIFKTQSRLTEIRQQIEKLTNNLKKWSDLVDLSTITINMSEKVPGAEKIKEQGYFMKLVTGFANSSKGVLSFCGAALVFIAQAIPVIILLGIIAAAALWIYRRFIKRIMDKKSEIK